jgi:hypothetical protein
VTRLPGVVRRRSQLPAPNDDCGRMLV